MKSHYIGGESKKIIGDNMQGLAEAMVSVYRSAMRIFLPTPAKSHYTFSLRDITRVFQGVVLVPAKRLHDPEKLGRLWAHETYRVFYDRYVFILFTIYSLPSQL